MGLIAMKLDEGDRLIGVATCREGQDAFLATRRGRCIRFELSDDTVRVFAGRDSSGVRGIRLADGDEVISLSVLRHVKASNEERAAYLRQASAKRRGNGDDETEAAPEPEETVAEVALDEQRIAQLEREEDFLLTVTDAGFGKRTSAYEYRVTGRGGQGIANITLAPRNGTAVVATLPVEVCSVLTRRTPTLPFQPPAFRLAMANPPLTFSSTEKTSGGLGMRLPSKLLNRVFSTCPRLTDQ